MPRKPTKPSAVRTSKPGVKATKPVESSVMANHRTRPTQPKVRKTPPRKPGPKPLPDGHRALGHAKAKAASKRETISAETMEAARATGLLPHEWLLAVMRGEQINHYAYDSETQEIVEIIVLPTFADRMEAAKSAAPYFATKLVHKSNVPGYLDPAKQAGVMEVPIVDNMEQWTNVASESQRKLKKEVTK